MTNTEGNAVYELMLVIVNHQYDKYWRVDLNECEEGFAFAFARINQPYDGLLYHGLFYPLISIYGKIGDGGSYFLYYGNVQDQPQQLLQLPGRPRGVIIPRGKWIPCRKMELGKFTGALWKISRKDQVMQKDHAKSYRLPRKRKKDQVMQKYTQTDSSFIALNLYGINCCHGPCLVVAAFKTP